ncbi:cytochrome P450-like protein 10 [Sarcoptes scabiei]|uniref:Cytochrome P450-like protein 10 n=1 Tax=Sarcoptes scabiei TaxID=52283 RepID=A0A131ZYF5_SARSC|nr:cytochrome P450-like protein 10 [Sarcoptes scabiei]
MGHFIPKDTLVLVNIWAVHHDSKIWDNPSKFNPYRFLTEDGKTLIDHEGFIPFSLGKRSCVAESFVRKWLFIFVVTIVQNFHIKSPNHREEIFDEKFNRISSIENGSLTTFFNNFIYKLLNFLSEFHCIIETKIIQLVQKLDQCQLNLVILEMKLKSLNGPSETDQNGEIKCDDSNENRHNLDKDIAESNEIVNTENRLQKKAESCPEKSEEISIDVQNGNDNNLQIYKRMLKFGVHEDGVRQKMLFDGVDPSLLNL